MFLLDCPVFRLKSSVRYLMVLQAVVVIFSACGKGKPTAEPASVQDIRANFIKAFFSTPFKDKGKFNGFWSVDPKDFAEYIENTYLKSYTPQPNEPSGEAVRNNIKAARYFLRIDGLACDELFFIDGGGFTGSAGTLKELEKATDRVAYSAIFIRRSSDGKRIREGAILTAFHKRQLLLEFPDRKLTFHPETKAPSVLAEQYGKPAFTTGLAEY
jgi:hypothetical protein